MLKSADLDQAENSLKTSLELYTQVNHTDMHYPLTALAEVYAERAKKTFPLHSYMHNKLKIISHVP